MVVGGGLIASAFLNSGEDFNNYIIFASGVSNSKEINRNEFKREKDLILKTISNNKGSKFIYFSSILAGVSDDMYYEHNLEMEQLVRDSTTNNIIFKLPQIIGGIGNGNNLVNYMVNSIRDGKELTIYKDIKRALLDVDDLVRLVNYTKDKVNCETINISHVELIDVIELYFMLEGILKKCVSTKIIDVNETNWFSENHPVINEGITSLGIKKIDYTYNVLKKYIK